MALETISRTLEIARRSLNGRLSESSTLRSSLQA
jgi:hypothetical protein